ncbi:putative Bro-N domain-containing protein [Yalta virus]|nr:putative Bro-N domain-containing protein [Yalta virus]
MENLMDRIGNIYFNEKKITTVIDSNNNVWFFGNEIGELLGFARPRDAIRDYVKTENKKCFENLKTSVNSIQLQNSTKFINKQGIKELLIKSKKSTEDCLIKDIVLKLNLNIDNIIKTKKEEAIENILHVFKNLNYEKEFRIGDDKIDLYFPDFKLAITCDENNISNYEREKERRRESYIKKQLSCSFIHFNPDQEDFDILNIIHKIFVFFF